MALLGHKIRLGASAAGAYEIERSLRFNSGDSTNLAKTFGTATNRKIWTYSGWFKRGNEGTLFGSYADGSTSWYSRFADNGQDRFDFTEYNGSSYVINLRPNQVLRDYSAWYHLVVAYDSTQGTASNRVKMYINGEQITSFATETYPSQNQESGINKNQVHHIGRSSDTTSSSYYANGYMTEIHFVDGQQLTPASFAKTDSITGAWVPIKYIGTYGNNGCYLNFSDNSGTTATTLGKDSSGNGNNLDPNNFSVAAAPANDSVLDTPTNNYCILDVLDKKDCIIVNGALSTATTAGGGHQPGFSTFGLTSGKWYVEGGKIGGNGTTVCVWPKEHDAHSLTQDHAVHNNAGNQNAKGYGFNLQYGSATHTPSHTVSSYTGTSFTTWMLALDLDNGKIWWGVDGTWGNNSGVGNPATGANPAFSDLISGYPGEVWSVGSMTSNGLNLSFNFGQQGFAYTPPDGFKPICTANLNTPDIKDGTKHFNTVLYTGNATSRNIVSDFDTGFVWIKRRSGQEGHVLSNIVVGANNFLSSNSTAAQNTASNCVTAFNSDGVTVGTQGIVNDNGQSFASWHWKAGGSGSTNTDGSVDTTVSVNSAAGFSIVKSTNSSVTNSFSTFGHGLSVAPDMIICKPRIDVTDNWKVYHKHLTANNNLMLHSDAVQTTYSNYINDVTATTFKMHAGGNPNDDLLAYCFSSVDGFSKCGFYYGNGSTNGTFVYTGFRPAYIVSKRIETTPNAYWNIWDSARDPYNTATTSFFKRLLAHTDGAEATNHTNYTPPDLLSNGFKLRHGSADKNYSGKKFIYFAFAESPFKYANAR